MGSRLARRLLAAGHSVTVWNRSAGKTDALTRSGASAAATPAEAARHAEFVITMVAGPQSLRAVTEGGTGVAAGAAGSLLIEMSTAGPAAVQRLAGVLPADAGLIDAPVLGSLAEADAGTLTIFAGGPGPRVRQAEPLLSTLGTVLHIGEATGSGAAAKLVANAALLAVIASLGEAVGLADSLGLAREAAYQVLAVTPLAAQADRRRAAIEEHRYPPRFRLALARKDADLIMEAANRAGADLRLAAAVRSWLGEAEREGRSGLDYTAILDTIIQAGAPGRRRQ
jgi:3-hydroxyisobutyrate dehydrogenase-like beta-hydroxyacid dehydrogenase